MTTTALAVATAWLELQDRLDVQPAAVPCRRGDPGTRARWTSDDTEHQAAAAAACSPCPALAACLTYAQAADERWGVWGATTPAERRTAQKANAE